MMKKAVDVMVERPVPQFHGFYAVQPIFGVPALSALSAQSA